MSWVGPAIQAGTALLGGLFGGPDPKGQQIGLQKSLDKQRPGWIRYGAEKAGFNPLVFAGPTGLAGTLPTGPGVMGDAIARAGAAISDGFSEKAQLDMQKAELEVERQRLEALREEVKLAPNVPGIYRNGSSGRRTSDGNAVGPSAPTAFQAPGAPARPSGTPAFGASGLPAAPYVDVSVLGASAGVAPGREVDVSPYVSAPGIYEVNSGLTGNKPLKVPGDGSPLGIDELGTIGAAWLFDKSIDVANTVDRSLTNWVDNAARARKKSAKEGGWLAERRRNQSRRHGMPPWMDPDLLPY